MILNDVLSVAVVYLNIYIYLHIAQQASSFFSQTFAGILSSEWKI